MAIGGDECQHDTRYPDSFSWPAGPRSWGTAVVHGVINVPHLREDMLEIGMRSSLLGAISLVLYFSVVAMFAFAALVLTGAISLLRGKSPQLAPLWLIAGSYLVFGLVAFVRI